MDRIRIGGGHRLKGEIPISGAKNATLPLMIASLLSDEPLTLTNVPHLADVTLLGRILGELGVDIMIAGRRHGQSANDGATMHLNAGGIVDTTARYELVSRMRASFWVVGPLVARMGEARVSMPGGCAIGTRPVDLHLMGLEALGAQIDLDGGYVVARAPGGLAGGVVRFPKVSVGATHNIMMAASLARGETVIENAACEPEVADVAACLAAMGAEIEGAGTSTIRIQGQERLVGACHEVLPDRIETGTYAMATAMAGGEVTLTRARADLIAEPIEVLRRAGVEVTTTNEGVHVARNGEALHPVDVETSPFPGFPTDLQAQLMALMSKADGTSTIRETIFENRFMHVQELARLGADIALDGDVATITGVRELKGAPVMATDLRA
ncbi:MAG: UDP-N-acetylglucosamine 1-carboxyvinyltransferase, partial [Rhizobiales bacterium]|nr:UDP-N-acetylglucosamine 1-carboxyvinyltransferase [Hyphomicrobiales bacterium]